jgi:hypothetical protein
MNISMNLSLVDTASPQIKAFISSLGSLEAAVTSAGAKMSAFATSMKEVQSSLSLSKARMDSAAQGIASIGAAAANAGSVKSFAAAMGALGASMGIVRTNASGVATSVGNIGTRANAAVGGTTQLNNTITQLGTALQNLMTHVNGAVSGMNGLNTAARTAGAGAANAMNNIGGGAQNANTHVNSLSDSIKGMALLWSAFELKKGLKASLGEASDFQKEMLTVGGLNLGDAANREIAQKAWEDSQNLRVVTPVEALRGRQAAIGGLAEPMNQDVLDKTIPAALKLANNLRFAGDKSDLEDMVRNLYGIVEARQQTEDPEAMLRTFDLVQKAFTATQKKVTPKDLEMFLRQLGQGASNISDDGLMRAVAAIDQMKIAGGAGSGGGASKYGTAVKMLQAYAMGKPMNKQGAAMLIESGILQPGAIDEDGNTTLSANIKPGGGKDQLLASQDINAWIEKFAPNIIAYTRKHANEYYQGKDMNDPKVIEAAVQKYLTALGITVTAQQAASLPLNPRSQARMEEQLKMQKGAAGVNEQFDQIQKSFDMAKQKFSTALETLGTAIGDSLLSKLTPLINGLAAVVDWFAKLAHDHDILTFIATLGAGWLAAAAAIKGFVLTFGPIASLLGVGASSFGVLGTAVVNVGKIFTSITAGIVEFGRFIAVVVRLILGNLGPLGWIITGIVIAWEAGLGDWISKLNVFGRSVGDWATILSDKVVTSFRNMWVRTKEFFGFLSKDAADAQVEANNRAHIHQIVQLSTGGAKPASTAAPTAGPAAKTNDQAPTEADRILIEQLALAEVAKLGPTVKPKPKGGRFKNYDANLDDAKNDLRLEEDLLARHMKAEEELYKANKISIDAYYDDKLATVRKSVNAQIAELEREKAAYQRQGDKAGVNRVNAEITLRKRDLADNEKSVEVEREKDLNALKERRLALEALILDAEGKRRQSQLAHDIQRAEKDKADFLASPDAPGSAEGVAAAQKVIDIAKLNAAWDQYGDDVKKIQEDTQTKEAQVDAQVKSGSLSKLTAEQKIFDLRKEEARQLDDLIKKERALIEASNAPQEVKDKLLKALDLAQAKAGATTSEMNPELARMKDTLNNSLKGGFENFFNSIISGAKSGASAIKQFADSIKSTITKLISEQLGKDLFKSLFGEGIGSGGGMLGDMFKGLFGGKSSSSSASAPAASKDSGGGILDGIVNWFRSFDVGTDNVPADMFAQIHKGEMIVPAYDAERLRSLTSKGQANTAPPTVTLQIHPDAMHMKLSDWLDGELSRQLAHR